MLPDRVSNPGPLTYESGALPIALRGPASLNKDILCLHIRGKTYMSRLPCFSTVCTKTTFVASSGFAFVSRKHFK